MSQVNPPSYEEATHPLNYEEKPTTPPFIPPPTFTGPTQQIVYVTQPVQFVFGKKPTQMICPFCKVNMKTTVQMEPTMMTHFAAGLLCLLGAGLCFWIPYVTDAWRSQKHYCSGCHVYLGVYSKW